MSDSVGYAPLKARINEAKPDATEGEMEARILVFVGGIGFVFLLEASDLIQNDLIYFLGGRFKFQVVLVRVSLL